MDAKLTQTQASIPQQQLSLYTPTFSCASSFADTWVLCVHLDTNRSTMQAQKQWHTSTNEWQRGNAHTSPSVVPYSPLSLPFLPPPRALSGWSWRTGWAKHARSCMTPSTHCSNKCSADFHKDNPKPHCFQDREHLLPHPCQFTQTFPPILKLSGSLHNSV